MYTLLYIVRDIYYWKIEGNSFDVSKSSEVVFVILII